jgi:hypothetical protein
MKKGHWTCLNSGGGQWCGERGRARQFQLGHEEINVHVPGAWSASAKIKIPIIARRPKQHCGLAETQELAEVNIPIFAYRPKLHCELAEIDFIKKIQLNQISTRGRKAGPTRSYVTI